MWRSWQVDEEVRWGKSLKELISVSILSNTDFMVTEETLKSAFT